MVPRTLKTGRVLCRVEIRVDELDEAVQILHRDRIVFLVKIVDISVEDLDKKLDRDGGIHTGISYAKGALKAFENAFAIAIKL